MVGAVVVQAGEVVAEGFHARFGADHAEVVALRSAGERAAGSTLYVTLEPCSHRGQTPPCVDAIVQAGVARVMIAARDPNPLAAGGVERLRAAGLAVEVGIAEAAARELNAAFFHSFGSELPWVQLKLAVSLDGAIAARDRRPAWLTGPESRREVHRMRANVDAIAVGLGTALADDPALTVREVPEPRVAPLRIVFDSQANLPLSSTLVRTAREVPTLVVACEPDEGRAAALREAGVELLIAASLRNALIALRTRGVRSLVVEGGARLAGSLLEAGLVQRLVIFQAPVILGAGALNAFAHAPSADPRLAPRARVVERGSFGDDLMTIYALDGSSSVHRSD